MEPRIDTNTHELRKCIGVHSWLQKRGRYE